MRKRKAAYRRQHQNKFSMFLVSLVVVLIMAGVAVKSMDLRTQLEDYQAQEASLDRKIEAQEERAEEIEEYGRYTQTKKFAEEIAKEKLGLVYEDEIVFRQEDD